MQGPDGGRDGDPPEALPALVQAVRQQPDGIYVYGAQGRRTVEAPAHRGRTSELVELCDALEHGRPTLLDARWGMATTEVCLAILQSSRERREIRLAHQVRLAQAA